MKNLRELLGKLNLSELEISVYSSLLEHGESTVLEISKDIKESRTSIYRVCKALREKQFIKKIKLKNTTKFKVTSFANIKAEINKKKKSVFQLRDEFTQIKKSYADLKNDQNGQIKVVRFTGVEEVKQLVWDTLKAEGETLGYGSVLFDKVIGEEFMSSWRERFNQLGLVDRQILNKNAIERIKMLKDNKSYNRRIIKKDRFEITQETFIYNNVFAIVQIEKGRVFGLEIYNEQVADQERGVFELLWKKAEIVK